MCTCLSMWNRCETDVKKAFGISGHLGSSVNPWFILSYNIYHWNFSGSAAANLVSVFAGECTEQNPFGEGMVLWGSIASPKLLPHQKCCNHMAQNAEPVQTHIAGSSVSEHFQRGMLPWQILRLTRYCLPSWSQHKHNFLCFSQITRNMILSLHGSNLKGHRTIMPEISFFLKLTEVNSVLKTYIDITKLCTDIPEDESQKA